MVLRCVRQPTGERTRFEKAKQVIVPEARGCRKREAQQSADRKKGHRQRQRQRQNIDAPWHTAAIVCTYTLHYSIRDTLAPSTRCKEANTTWTPDRHNHHTAAPPHQTSEPIPRRLRPAHANPHPPIESAPRPSSLLPSSAFYSALHSLTDPVPPFPPHAHPPSQAQAPSDSAKRSPGPPSISRHAAIRRNTHDCKCTLLLDLLLLLFLLQVPSRHILWRAATAAATTATVAVATPATAFSLLPAAAAVSFRPQRFDQGSQELLWPQALLQLTVKVLEATRE